jgi:hypothetical protein
LRAKYDVIVNGVLSHLSNAIDRKYLHREVLDWNVQFGDAGATVFLDRHVRSEQRTRNFTLQIAATADSEMNPLHALRQRSASSQMETACHECKNGQQQ